MKRKLTYLILLLFVSIVFVSAQDTFNIATYNIRYKNEKDGPNQWTHRVDHLKSLIVYHDFDIFGTQEGLKEQLDDLAELDGYNYFGLGRDDGKEAGEHSAIFYKYNKFELLEHGDFWLSQTPKEPSFGWDAACKRICTWGLFKSKATGSEFYMFNVHFDHRGPEAKLNSAKLLIERVKEIAGNEKVFVTGDFNLTPETEGIQIMKKGLLDSREISKQSPYGPLGTGNGFDINRELIKRIDYIFVNNGISVNKYATLSDTYNNRYPSDHLPVVVEVVIK